MSLNLDKSQWERVKFGDVIESITDRVDNPSEAGVDRYVGLEHLDPGVLTVQRWDSPDKVEAQKLRFQPGDVIFGKRRAYQKKVAVANFEGICSAHALVLRARPEKILPEFLPIFLSSDYFLDRAISISVGSLSPTINWRDLKVQEFDLPPLHEQKRLADLLWAVEEHYITINSVRESIDKAYEIYSNKLFKSIEENYGRKNITELVREKITDGVREKGPDLNEGVPYIRVNDMTSGQLDTRTMLRMSSNIADANLSSRMYSGDIVMALRSKIGLCHIIPKELDNCNIAQGVAKISPNFAIVSSEYLYEVLSTPYIQKELDILAKGTTIREVGLSALRKFSLPIPLDLSVQKDIVYEINKIRSAKENSEMYNKAVYNLKSTLLSTIFGGSQ